MLEQTSIKIRLNVLTYKITLKLYNFQKKYIPKYIHVHNTRGRSFTERKLLINIIIYTYE